MQEIGVRALREHLSQVLGQVRAGESVIVTSNGEPIARIEPVRPDMPEDVRELLASGLATGSGEPLEDFEPIEITPGPSLSDILLAQRGPKNPYLRSPGADAVPGQ
jgi:prevent-host-death family protein